MTLTVEMHGGIYSYSDNINKTQSWSLDEIPRYAEITGLSIKSRTINSITISYSVSRSANIFVRLTSGGDSTEWLNNGNPFVSNTTSGDITIYYKNRASTNRLTPNSSYTIEILSRATISGLDRTKSVSGTTYDIAKLVSVPNINIGASQALTWTNPSGASTSLKLCKTDNSTITDYGTVTGTSKTVTPTANTIYALTPNSSTYTARYIITTTANNTSYTNSKDFTFTVTNSNPTFTNFNYADTNNKTITLTGNNQILIKGYSNNSIMIEEQDRAIAKNSASMLSYKVVQGSKSDTKPYSGSSGVLMSISNVDSPTMTVSATDSRSLSTSIQKTAIFKNYSDVVIKSVNATRGNNGVGESVTLTFNGSFWNDNFGAVTNAIKSVTYQYKETSSNEWSNSTALIPTITNSDFNGSISIQGDKGANGFSVEKSFNIRLTVTDELSTKTFDTILGSGTPAMAIYKDNVAIGQKYDTSKGGKLQVNGDLIAAGDNVEIGYKIYNTDNVGMVAKNSKQMVVQSSKGLWLKLNNYYDGTNDKFIEKNIQAIQINMTSEGKFQIRRSTNTPTPNVQIIWGSFTNLDPEYLQHLRSRGIITQESGSTKPAFSGISMQQAYNNSYPASYGNILTLNGAGSSQLFLGWEGNSQRGKMFYRSLRDYTEDGTTWSGWGRIYTASDLYYNASGTTGTVTLGQSAANYDFLEIHYFSDLNNDYGSVKIGSPNGKKFRISWNEMSSDSNVSNSYTFGTQFQINGTTISVYNTAYGIVNLGNATFYKQNRTKIWLVRGYR